MVSAVPFRALKSFLSIADNVLRVRYKAVLTGLGKESMSLKRYLESAWMEPVAACFCLLIYRERAG